MDTRTRLTGRFGRGQEYRPGRLPGAFVAVGLVLVVGGCAGSQRNYVSNTSFGAFFAVPDDWRVYDAAALQARRSSTATSAQPDESQQWMVAFDADPQPDIEHIFNQPAKHPTGFAQVRRLTPEERDAFSLASLRNVVLPVDRLAQVDDDSVEAVSNTEISTDQGLRGNRLVLNITMPTGGTFTFDQTGLVDAQTQTVYVFAIACEVECYENQRNAINRVVDSWTVTGGRNATQGAAR